MKKMLLSTVFLIAGLALFCSFAQAADKADDGVDFLLVRGTISALDARTKKVTVRREDKKEIVADFRSDRSTVWVGYEDVDFTDLKKGQLVDMECAGPEDKRTVNWIEIYETQETAPAQA